MRTRHALLDMSDFSGQVLVCHCGHWTWRAPWEASRHDADDLWAEHRRLWDEAEAELDNLEQS